MTVRQDTIIGARLAQGENFIICKRLFDHQKLSQQLYRHVRNKENVLNVVDREIYAICRVGKPWVRAMVKCRPKNKTIFTLLDKDGVFDYDPTEFSVRKLEDEQLREMPCGLFKVFIYGIGPYKFDEKFKSYFEQTVQNERTIAFYSLIGNAVDKAQEAFAGDLVYQVNGQYKSFRDILIRERISYPSRVREPVNQQIFVARAVFLMQKNNSAALKTMLTDVYLSGPISKNEASAYTDAGTIVFERFRLVELIGEGTVSVFL